MALLNPAKTVETAPENLASTLTAELMPDPILTETFAPVEQPGVAVPQTPTETVSAVTAVTAPISGGHLTVQDFSEAGFEGLVIDARTFPIINLKNNGRFMDMDDYDYGTEMRGHPLSSTEKVVITAKFPDPYKPKTFIEETAFCLNETRLASGRLVADWKDEMIRRGDSSPTGTTFDERRYTDVLVVMDQPGAEFDGEMRIWSVAPTSRGRLFGVLNIAAVKAGWRTAQEVKEKMPDITLAATVGAAVAHDKGTFNPWNFKAV